ncbi:cytochrome b5-like heme/steroid binding domain-containing protein [Melampsora americana]|nr:cytochrome b5-like heme/steroid binding domain-containing protein [Melampsora americana]
MFPAQDSIQRASSSKPQSTNPSFQISTPEDDEEENESDEDFQLNISEFDSLPPPTSTLVKPKVLRQKVKLQPGFSQLDWAKLKSSGKNLRGEGIFSIRRISRDELSKHNQKEDAWSSFHGKVYNITPYLNYHPGGSRELMRVAGKDGTELFMKTHAWINVDGMMDGCMIGFLVN